jgi:hypothetical protein
MGVHQATLSPIKLPTDATKIVNLISEEKHFFSIGHEACRPLTNGEGFADAP